MNESDIQSRRRDQDEEATRKRASILGVQYLDTREFEQDMPLIRDVLNIEEMYGGRLVPLDIDQGSQTYKFGMTSQTPQSLVSELATNYKDTGKTAHFFLISGSAFRTLMLRFDPPKKVIYDDIEIAKDGDSNTLVEVSKTLASVGSDDVFNYLID